MFGCRPTSTSLGASIHMRAVVGRKGLVELGHVAADARRLLDQVHLEAGSGKIEGGLDTADPSADDHDVSEVAFGRIFTQLLHILFERYYVFHSLSPHLCLNYFLENLGNVFHFYVVGMIRDELAVLKGEYAVGTGGNEHFGSGFTACSTLMLENRSCFSVSIQILPPPMPQQRLSSRDSDISMSSTPGIFLRISRGSSKTLL